MPPRKKQQEERWIEGQEAAAIMSQRNGHTISLDYVRLLGRTGKITMRKKDGRTNEYLLSDVEAYQVRANYKGGQGKRDGQEQGGKSVA